MNTERNLSKDGQTDELNKITEDEIYSELWSRVIVKKFETLETHVYCKKENLVDSPHDIVWFYELSVEDDPKCNLDRYLSRSKSDYIYSDHNRGKIFHDDNFDTFVLDGEEWLYYKTRKHKVSVESLDGTYQEDFIIEHMKSFSGIPIYEKKNYKDEHEHIINLLSKKLSLSIVVKNKDGHLVSILDENNPPSLFVDKFSDMVKKSFLATLLISLMFVGGFTFLIPIYLFSLLFSTPMLMLLSFAYISLGCKYMVVLMMAYPIEITSRVGNYIYKDKYELKRVHE